MLRKPTEWFRATTQTVGRVVVPPEPFFRRVTIVVPSSDSTEIGFCADIPDMERKLKDADLMSQDALLPLAPSDVTIPVLLAPYQAVIARCREGNTELSFIVEYLAGGDA